MVVKIEDKSLLGGFGGPGAAAGGDFPMVAPGDRASRVFMGSPRFSDMCKFGGPSRKKIGRRFRRLKIWPSAGRIEILNPLEILKLQNFKCFTQKTVHSDRHTREHARNASVVLRGCPDNNYVWDFVLASIIMVFQVFWNFEARNFEPVQNFGGFKISSFCGGRRLSCPRKFCWILEQDSWTLCGYHFYDRPHYFFAHFRGFPEILNRSKFQIFKISTNFRKITFFSKSARAFFPECRFFSGLDDFLQLCFCECRRIPRMCPVGILENL